ncbi:MAG: cell wall-associated NlpC family hydrolase [Rhodothermales bacterium]|jgi:cell wall-associated NlpC family hydrolase
MVPRTAEPVRGAEALLLENLRSEIGTWMGTPYEWGGDDRNGVDCSAFVQNVYEDVLGVGIARTTGQQQSEGSAVSRSALEPGDLIFFHTPKRTDHVGIYLGEGDFAHASSSRGVMISNLTEDYWKAAYTQARRPHQLELSPTPISTGIADDEPTATRTGW